MSLFTEVSNWILGTYKVRTTQLDPPFESVVQHVRLDQGDGTIPNDVSFANPLFVRQGYRRAFALTPVAGFLPSFSTILVMAINPDRGAFEITIPQSTGFIYFGWDFFPNVVDYSFRLDNKEKYVWNASLLPPTGELYAYTEATSADFTITEYNSFFSIG